MSLESSTIVYGLFQLKDVQKHKYAVILHNDSDDYIITTFTTSKKRAGDNPSHGANEYPESYVFKSKVVIGISPDESDFSFAEDTIVVPDYGIQDLPVENFLNKVSGLKTVCILHKKEYFDLLYFLYKSQKTKLKYVSVFENILRELSS